MLAKERFEDPTDESQVVVYGKSRQRDRTDVILLKSGYRREIVHQVGVISDDPAWARPSIPRCIAKRATVLDVMASLGLSPSGEVNVSLTIQRARLSVSACPFSICATPRAICEVSTNSGAASWAMLFSRSNPRVNLVGSGGLGVFM